MDIQQVLQEFLQGIWIFSRFYRTFCNGHASLLDLFDILQLVISSGIRPCRSRNKLALNEKLLLNGPKSKVIPCLLTADVLFPNILFIFTFIFE